MQHGLWKVALAGMMTLVATLAVMWLMPSTVAADGGPHGGYTTTTGLCQACHSPHRATSTNILKGGTGTTYSFCTTCHGASGDAGTDVLSGSFAAAGGAWTTPAAYGDATKQLNGGRFTSAASIHTVDTDLAGQTIWGGNSTTGADTTLTAAFKCTTCHDTHGKSLAAVGGTGTQGDGTSTDNYRLLNNAPVKTWESATNFGTGVAKSYTRSSLQASGASDGMVNFCTSCHADYEATTAASGSTGNKPSTPTNTVNGKWAHPVTVALNAASAGAHTNLGASSYKLPVEQAAYAHWYSVLLATPTASGAGAIEYLVGGVPTAASYSATNDKVGCTTCHNPHGSLATLATTYGTLASGDDSLIRFNDRTVCQSCHAK